MDSSSDGAEGVEKGSLTSPNEIQSPAMDRNPSPPPETADGEEDDDLDAIGDTVYSKHWLFSTLTRLIHMVTEHSEQDTEGQMQLPEDDEEDLCKVWDMAMDKDVAGFLQEFKASDILLGVIAKSHCPRLTEICVGILGNIACFPDTCLTLSQNEDLGAVLLLLLGDTDPQTLLETSRLLLTCVSQKDVCSLWLQRIRQQPVQSSLCFIMCSSTNTDLLEKVGELVDKLFDLDEELMKSWITAQPTEEEDDGESHLDVASCLVEAAKQLRRESLNGLEIYLHALQLLTTIDEGIQVFAATDGPGKTIWDFVSEVVCEDLCQPNDLPVILQEQKSILVQAFSVLQALYSCQDQWKGKSDASLPLIATILRVLQYHTECRDDGTDTEDRTDDQLQTLLEITAEFLADICKQISKDSVAELVKKGFLTEKTCVTAACSLLPTFRTSFQHLQLMLAETDPQLADVLRKQFPD
ncbi:protein saal1 [Echeneis naucrates]|uniref:Serum amyloid A like 1 n=1 Tax=Echeneis naucrates TaxID=173247 RepID=A0A665UM92_ECHNA|nr:protein SAAL1 [Echeneis naucrates]